MQDHGGTNVNVNNPNAELQQTISPLLNARDENVCCTQSVTINGLIYRSGSFMVHQIDDTGEFKFASVSQIFIIHGIVQFWCKTWEMPHFDRHRHSYVVRPLNNFKLLLLNDLCDNYPLSCCMVNDAIHIVLKYRIYGENVF